MPFVHDLKTWPEAFAAMRSGAKRAEFRPDDRGGFRVGDLLHLREWDPAPTCPGLDGLGQVGYTGETFDVEVTHVVPGGAYGIPAGFVMMSVIPHHAAI